MSVIEEALAQPVGNLALCWRLARPDGVVLGYTSHDRNLRIDDVVYRATPGMTPSAVVQTEGLDGDSMAVEGVLDAASVTALDLSAGRWRGAAVEVLVCDWTDPAAWNLCLSRGRIGDVSRPAAGSSGAFRVELLTEIDLSNELLPLRLSPTCRNELGDRGCGVDLDGRRLDGVVIEGLGSRIRLAVALEDPSDFEMGWVRFLSGPLCGIDRQIAVVESDELVIDGDLPAVAFQGVRVRLTPGCDKRLSTCAQRFGNVRMFGGEPHLPGTDALVRYARS
jgi:uncharacterized phage protein (TIGR02218 family)